MHNAYYSLNGTFITPSQEEARKIAVWVRVHESDEKDSARNRAFLQSLAEQYFAFYYPDWQRTTQLAVARYSKLLLDIDAEHLEMSDYEIPGVVLGGTVIHPMKGHTLPHVPI